MIAKLILVAGKADKGEVTLHLPTLVGRMKGAGLMIAHSTVSRRHCEIFPRDDVLYVRDLGSLNGTVVDGQTLKDAESPLLPGQTVTIGPLTFRAAYETTAKVPAAAAPDSTLANVGETVEMAASDATIEDISTATDQAASHPPIEDAADGIDALVFEEADELALDFDIEESSETATSPVSADMADEIEFDLADESAPSAGALDDEEPPQTSGIADLAKLAMEDLDGADDDLTFDLADEPASSPASAAAAASDDEVEAGFELKDLALDDDGESGDDLMFDLAADDAAAPAVDSLSDGDEDELEFKLEDFDEPAPKKNGAEPKPAQKAPSSVQSNQSDGGEEDLDKFFDDLGL